MSRTDQHIRHCLLYEFHLRKTPAEANQNICTAYGDDALSKRTCERWFAKFRSGNEDLEDELHQRGPSEFSDENVQSVLDAEPRATTREIAEKLGCSHTAVEYHLHKMGKVNKLGVWVPHELSEANLIQRMAICSSLLSRFTGEPFLDRIITGDEKWVLYTNVTRKRQWVDKDEQPQATPKAELHQKKLMLCVWWNMTGILHFELLPSNRTVTAEIYADQLERVQASLIESHPALVNRKGVILLHDNARPHVAKMVHEKIVQLGWEVLAHPAYSPDLAPTDYHLFRALQNHLHGKSYEKDDDIQNDIQHFFDSKPPTFYETGFCQLVQRWRYVIDNNGAYYVD